MTDVRHLPQRGPRIALISFSSLGDGLIYLMMAENLLLNGYPVTCFGNIAHQLAAWLPQLEIRPYPAREGFEGAFDAFDLVIASPPQFLRDTRTDEEFRQLAKRWILVCQKTPESWIGDHHERIRRTKPEHYEHLKPLLNAAGSIRCKPFSDESVVEMTLVYMREKMGLEKTTRHVRLTPPPGVAYRKHRRRIIVSPDSAGPEKKDWTPSRFVRLCRKLAEHGYEPHVVVSPANHPAWAARIGHEFPAPVFGDIGKLAAYIYESGALIANDSGNGHLASFLGIPTVTIYRKRNPRFHWRPDWHRSAVICPEMTVPTPRGPLWKPFVRDKRILDAIAAMTEPA